MFDSGSFATVDSKGRVARFEVVDRNGNKLGREDLYEVLKEFNSQGLFHIAQFEVNGEEVDRKFWRDNFYQSRTDIFKTREDAQKNHEEAVSECLKAFHTPERKRLFLENTNLADLDHLVQA